MPQSFLITQCLQNDFIKPVEIHEPLPNLLHIGFEESKRLMGEMPAEGVLMQLMRHAYSLPVSNLHVVNICDWHDPEDPSQQRHLQQFGLHCIQNTFGAQLVFESVRNHERDTMVYATGLNDFMQPDLSNVFNQYQDQTIKVGIIGVWTEAKITYLAYELSSRYPKFEIAICSALTASSSTHMHFVALEQIKKILGVKIIPSVNEFLHFLSGELLPFPVNNTIKPGGLTIHHSGSLTEQDAQLVRFLFRNSHRVSLKSLDGGFSGNLVLKCSAIDIHGHEEAPSVTKIGERNSIAAERDAFERVKNILGNNAPQIVDYAETQERAGIKYRYASMLDEHVKTFKDWFAETEDVAFLTNFLNIVFKHQLNRFYKAATREKVDLYAYYDFSQKYVDSIRKRMSDITGQHIDDSSEIAIAGLPCYNLLHFYQHDLPVRNNKLQYSHYFSYVHGDLNGANILIDGHFNVWLIDFFHTHRGHVLKDLIKLENDILYIYTPVHDKAGFDDGVKLVHALTDIDDLWDSVHDVEFNNPGFNKSYRIIRYLRSLYKDLVQTDRDPIQLFIGLLRYSVHTLSFEECSVWQKKLALYTSCHLAFKLSLLIKSSNELRFIYLMPVNNQIGLTILPGRKDRNRSLQIDVAQIKNSGFTAVVSLLSKSEYEQYGVPDLVETYRREGLICYELNIIDQGTPTKEDMKAVNRFIHENSSRGKKVLIHCVGGLGRTGMVAACYLKEYMGLNAQSAINLIRNVRSKRAIESKMQEDFVREYL